jgi:uncharacterized NAD(P)/FAD-binding protein YdhS
MARLRSYDAAIIGGGIAGSVVAGALAKLAAPGFTAVLLDPRTPGPGTAYRPSSDQLLMNGPACAMSLVPGNEQHLVRWLGAADDHALISRAQYGRYASETLREALHSHPGLSAERAEVVDIEPRDGGYALMDATGIERRAHSVVFALGNFAPDDSFVPRIVRQHTGYIGNPWHFDASDIDGDIALIGSGLTAMDVIALLAERGFGGRIHLVSRHGLLPGIEDARVRGLDPKTLALQYESPYTLLRSLRRAAQAHVESGGDWREVVEAIRRISPAIWEAWSLRERRRFLRHAQAFWSAHRYRVPPATYRAYEAFEQRGSIVRHRGHLRDATITNDGNVRLFVDHAGVGSEIDAAHIVNCTGPNGDYRRQRSLLVQNATRRGLMRADALHLGIDATADLRLIGRDGMIFDRLFTLGPPLRGLLYETTAVPETREQAARIAQEIAEMRVLNTLEAAS